MRDIDAGTDQDSIIISDEIFERAVEDVGAFFEPLSKTDRRILASDHLDLKKSKIRAQLLETYAPMHGKTVLEIGSGYGTNLAVWIKEFGVDGYGVEPASLGFQESFRASKMIFDLNGLNGERLIDASAECLPFSDNFFDIVYSANVLEHTADPLQVLREAARVVKPGGIIHMEVPNYLSYIEGHYMIPMPPVWSRKVLAFWVRLFGRDPSFVHTLRLINPIWCRHAIRTVSQSHPLRLISLGEKIFLAKLETPYKFETRTVSTKLGSVMRFVQTINVKNWIGRCIVAAQGHYPIYITIEKKFR